MQRQKVRVITEDTAAGQWETFVTGEECQGYYEVDIIVSAGGVYIVKLQEFTEEARVNVLVAGGNWNALQLGEKVRIIIYANSGVWNVNNVFSLFFLEQGIRPLWNSNDGAFSIKEGASVMITIEKLKTPDGFEVIAYSSGGR